ncbi:MAG: membrane protein insertase YidC [Methylacidiphilales bacterium]|nr:membrane protein insertase YidC [Candidatus Methylacidiphilales bacterium]MDW8349606.1 membrane protein insertase YidC [Verrucomicrobiae bacterium]
MDRTSWIGLLISIILLIAWNFYIAQKYPVTPPTKTPPPQPPPSSQDPTATSPLQEKTPPILTAASSASPPPPNLPPAELLTIENDYLHLQITTHGGGIHKATLKKHKTSTQENITFTATQGTAILSTQYNNDTPQTPTLFTLTKPADAPTPTIQAHAEILPGLLLRRTFTLTHDYALQVVQTLENTTSSPITIPASKWHLGHAAPTCIHDRPEFIGAGWLDPQAHYHKTMAHSFDGFNFLGIPLSPPKAWTDTGSTPPLWVTLKNQYFVTVALPLDHPHLTRTEFRPLVLPPWTPYSLPPRGVRADITLPESILPPRGSITQKLLLYIGPKEYNRIKKLGLHTEEIMEFGFFSWLVKPLLHTMNAIYHTLAIFPPIQSYGLAITLLAIIVKLILWPLQSAANRSMKKIQALAPKMKELQEKYKDDPTKLQTEIMKLYTDYGVNPLGGCLPLLPQIPIFIAFYTMLQHAIEIRHASFLWIKDLSRPDTIFTIPIIGLDINPLPLIMTATSIYIMHMTPTTAENQQYKIMRWLPLIFIPLFYGFASALSLYWTVNNLVSIIQTYHNLKKPIPQLKRVERKPNSRLEMFQRALEEQRRLQQQAKKRKP